MRAVALTSAKAGIQRLRTKGGAKPDSLFDQVNCYTTQANSVVPRPGTAVDTVLPPGTIGLTFFAGKMVVFSDHGVDLTAHPDYTLEILTYPGELDLDNPQTLKRIHFAEPMLGLLYVVARWSDDTVYHYYLSTAEQWQAGHVYGMSAFVWPTDPNGYSYRAHRIGAPGSLWAPGVERKVGDVVEPTTYNGFEYVCTEAYGSPPRSGPTEPVWPTASGAVAIEEADVALPPPSGQQQPPTSSVPPRYSNPGGSSPSGGGGGGGDWQDNANQVLR